MTGALRESARLVAAGTRREVSGGAARTRLGGATTGPSVTVCRSRTAGLAAVCREADVLVSAAAAALTRCPAAWGR
jgi:hypothetical protein